MYAFWGMGLALRTSPELSLVHFLNDLYPWLDGTIIYLILVVAYLLAAIFYVFVDTRDPRTLAVGLVPLIFYAATSVAWFILDPRVGGAQWTLPVGLVLVFAFGIFHQATYIEDDEDAYATKL